jgi:hypothetical protein
VVRTAFKVVATAVAVARGLLNAEARGLLDVERLVEAIRTAPRWLARLVHDIVVALTQMRPDEKAPWHAFWRQFTRVHTRE